MINIPNIQKVALFHKSYEEEYLNKKVTQKDVYLSSREAALFCILSYSFYQGRKDEVSVKFEERARIVLSEYLTKNDMLSQKSDRIRGKEHLAKTYSSLYEQLHQGGVNKGGDRLMIISLINLIQSLDEKNIVRFIIEKIKARKIAEVYIELDDIWSIGQKVTAFILRDLVCVHNLREHVTSETYHFLQPVDGWVHTISKALNLIDQNKKNIYANEALDITKRCLDLKIDPIHFNQGAWYLGKHSLKIVLKNLGRLEI